MIKKPRKLIWILLTTATLTLLGLTYDNRICYSDWSYTSDHDYLVLSQKNYIEDAKAYGFVSGDVKILENHFDGFIGLFSYPMNGKDIQVRRLHSSGDDELFFALMSPCGETLVTTR